MRVLTDTNILFSAILFPESNPAKAIECVIGHHKLVLCEQNITELREIINRKAPKHRMAVERLIKELTYEEIHEKDRNTSQIRDITDQPIVNAAIENNVDIILTGDKDFLSMDIEHPKCMTAVEFLKEEGYL